MKIICITPIKHLSGLYELMASYGSVIYKPEIKKKQLNIFLKNKLDINCIFCNPNKQNYIIDKNVLSHTGIKVINSASTGLNHINLKDCEELNIEVLSLKKDYRLLKHLPSTSELAFSLMVSLLKNINNSFKSVIKGKWNYEPFIGKELASLSIGIIGYGRLGKFMSTFCKSFGMKIYIYDPYKRTKKYINSSLTKIINECDVITLHVHVNKQTQYMINNNFLKKLKKKPLIINTSRGEIVCEKDIILALKKGIISGYGADVIEDEFGKISKSLILKGIKENLNILITPHVGGMTWQGQKRAWIWAINKFKFIRKYLDYNQKYYQLVKSNNQYKKNQKIS